MQNKDMSIFNKTRIRKLSTSPKKRQKVIRIYRAILKLIKAPKLKNKCQKIRNKMLNSKNKN